MIVVNDVFFVINKDSDIKYGLFDGDNYVGFMFFDIMNYCDYFFCYGVEGIFGVCLGF